MSTRHLQEKWEPILSHQDLPEIKDPYRKAVTAQLLENQEKFLREQSVMGNSHGLLSEDNYSATLQGGPPTNNTNPAGDGYPDGMIPPSGSVTGDLAPGYSGYANAQGPVAGFDPVLISLIRRSMPNLIAYDVCGVQPMGGPTGLIFAMRSMYDGPNGPVEALFDEADTSFSANLGLPSAAETGAYTRHNEPPYDYVPGGASGATGGAPGYGSNPGDLLATATTVPSFDSDPDAGNVGGPAGEYDPMLGDLRAMQTHQLEHAGMYADTPGGPAEGDYRFRQMGFSIEKVVVEARGRALKAQYSMELAQDLRAVHGLDAEAELANILSSEILSEINREVIRTVYRTALPGAANNVNQAGTFDLDLDSNGRWSVEKFKGLLFQIERDCNAIAQLTRRGKGNFIICSADVASALTMAGVLDYTPALNANLNVDDTGNLFAGTINGKLKVYIDPFSANVSDTHYYLAGYKGTNAYDAGLFYCPYIPLQMVRSVSAETFQPNIGFKTRYGIVANPYAEGGINGNHNGNQGLGRLADNTNRYYRRVKIANLM
jgi:hypothetical protein